MTKVIFLKVLLSTVFFVYAGNSIAQDITYLTGSGNFTNGKTTDVEMHQINALNFTGAKRTRISLYPSYYFNPDTKLGNPSSIDSIMTLLYQGGITPMILFEYYGWYNALGSNAKWYEIGRSFAERWRPNSPYLLSKNIKNWGISVYSAINEPDINTPYIPKTKLAGPENYHDALEGLADGIHSIASGLSAIPGGWASQNAYSWNNANGYATAIVDLINNGKLAGFDIHTYNDNTYAPIVDKKNEFYWRYSAQADFNEIQEEIGIKRPIQFYTTEFGYKANTLGINENESAKRLFTCIWNNIGAVKSDGSSHATEFALVWNLFHTVENDSTYGMCNQLFPYVPNLKGQTFKLAMELGAGMNFTYIDPNNSGIYKLTDGKKDMWVWQNYYRWSNINGTAFTVDLPKDASKILLYGYGGLIDSVEVTGLQKFTFTQLPESETLVFVILKKPFVSGSNDLNPHANFRWTASPNPVADIVSVTVEGNPISLKNSIVQVKDLTGKLILEKAKDRGDFSIDMTTFTAGVYLMMIGNSEAQTCIKLVKM
ncbi:MAG: T9SS type A sorting domain-containing protein [Saprospiraceae bacterium]